MSAKIAAPLLHLIALSRLRESPLNPRKHFDPVALKSLEASLRTRGQLTPILVRPVEGEPDVFELAAGHRRFRAAKAAELPFLEAKVSVMDDATFIETLTIENDEREDVHALEQANGYRLLMVHAGYNVAKIAERFGRSHDFVYDRLSLLQLNDDLKELFLEGRFLLSHALLLAKLSPAEQGKTAAKPKARFMHGTAEGGLWRTTGPTLDDETFPLVPRSPDELEHWIATELRFDPNAVVVEELFPETAEALEAAAETGTKVISVTAEDYLRPNAKDKSGDRTYTRKYWKRADGLEGSKECDYAVVGILVAGDARGHSLGVCIRRDKCKVHWSADVARAKARAKIDKATTPKAKAKAEMADRRRAAAEKAAATKQRTRERLGEAAAALIEDRLKALYGAPKKGALKMAREHLLRDASAPQRKAMARASAEELLVWLAVNQAVGEGVQGWMLVDSYHGRRMQTRFKLWGIDVKKILASIVLPDEPAVAADDEEGSDDE